MLKLFAWEPRFFLKKPPKRNMFWSKVRTEKVPRARPPRTQVPKEPVSRKGSWMPKTWKHQLSMTPASSSFKQLPHKLPEKPGFHEDCLEYTGCTMSSWLGSPKKHGPERRKVANKNFSQKGFLRADSQGRDSQQRLCIKYAPFCCLGRSVCSVVCS